MGVEGTQYIAGPNLKSQFHPESSLPGSPKMGGKWGKGMGAFPSTELEGLQTQAPPIQTDTYTQPEYTHKEPWSRASGPWAGMAGGPPAHSPQTCPQQVRQPAPTPCP